MTGARDRIMSAVRDGLVRAVLPGSGASEDEPRWRPPVELPPPASLVAAFTAAVTALTGTVHRAASAEDAAGVVAGIANAHGAATFMSWDDDQLGCPGLLAALAARGLARTAYDLSSDPGMRLREVSGLAELTIGLTGSHAALSDGGAVVLMSGAGRGRLASLLPPVHIALVRETRVFPSLPALLQREPWLVGQGSNLVVVAGPSRTADIEMTLTHGVHGPKHLHVILVP